MKTTINEENIQNAETEIKNDIITDNKVIQTQTQVNVIKKKEGHIVFKTQGEYLDVNGEIIQYCMDCGDEIVIGLENRSNMQIKLQLIIEGAVIINTGKSVALFYSYPRERKIFKLKANDNLSENVVFQFIFV